MVRDVLAAEATASACDLPRRGGRLPQYAPRKQEAADRKAPELGRIGDERRYEDRLVELRQLARALVHRRGDVHDEENR